RVSPWGLGARDGRVRSSSGQLLHDGQEFGWGEGLCYVAVRALTLAPHSIALLAATGHDDDRGVLRPVVPLERAENLVAVPVGHDDVEQYEVRTLDGHLVLDALAGTVRQPVMPGRPQNGFHHAKLGRGVVDDHHLVRLPMLRPFLAPQQSLVGS